MESDDAETSAGFQRPLGGAQPRVQLVQLVVHEDSQGLEGFRRHVRRALESVFTCVGDEGRKCSWKQKQVRVNAFDESCMEVTEANK